MAKSEELKVAEALVNASESHWFNSSIMARYMSNQPYYTLDRIMELCASLIHEIARRHGAGDQDGIDSEGTYLANELSFALKEIKQIYKFNNLNLPKTTEEIVARLPKYETKASNRHSWLDDKDDTVRVTLDHPFF